MTAKIGNDNICFEPYREVFTDMANAAGNSIMACLFHTQFDNTWYLINENRCFMATIKDVALRAGVSISTVSHVLNKTRFVSSDLEEKVYSAIRELDYKQHSNSTKKSRFIKNEPGSGFIVVLESGDSEDYLVRSAVKHIRKELLPTGYSLVTVNYNYEDKFDYLAKQFLSHPGAVGLIAFPGEDSAKLLDYLKDVDIPTVLVSRPREGINVGFVTPDVEGGTYRGIRHLIRSGHERIAILCDKYAQTAGILYGYQRALKYYDHSFDSSLVKTGLDKKEDVFSALDELYSLEVPPTAVMAASYSVASPLFKYMGANNIRCPQDVSVVCAHDFEWASLHTPPLTVVRQDTPALAKAAVELLKDRIDNAGEDGLMPESTGTRSMEKLIPAKLLVRSSTAGIAHGPFGEIAGSVETLSLTEKEISTICSGNYTAAISFHYTGKSWMDLLVKGVNAVFQSLNISVIATTDAHFSPELQSKQLESLSMMEPDIIIAMPTDDKKTSKAFQNVAKSKSKLILITNVPEGLSIGDYVTCVSVNESSHGRNIGQGLGDYMVSHGLTKAALIKHGSDFYATNQRDWAAEQVLSEEFDSVDICAKEIFIREEDAYDATIKLLKKHPEIEAIYTSWEGPAIEVMRALTDIGRTNIAVATGDLDINTALLLARGGMIKSLSAQKPFEEGEAIALAAANALLGKSPPTFIGIEPLSVSPDNILKMWKEIYKEEPPKKLWEALKENPSYIPNL